MRGSDMAAPTVGEDAEVADLLGNFEEIAPWGRQRHVGEGQIAADKCVVFLKDVDKGGAVECDMARATCSRRAVNSNSSRATCRRR